MHVWLITVGEPLPLPGQAPRLWRTGLLAELFAKRGHDVTWWTSSVDHFRKVHYFREARDVEVSGSYRLRFLHGCLYKKNISFARLRNHHQIAAQFRGKAAPLPRPDVILCSYPTIELGREAVRFGKEHNVPVLLDIRDLWPDEIEAALPGGLKWLGRLLLWPMHKDARFTLAGASGIIAVSRRYLSWALALAGRAPNGSDAIFTHGYPVPQVVPVESSQNEEWLCRLRLSGGQKIVWFVGTFVGSIDLGTVIEAARTLTSRQDIVFVLSGSGEREAEWRRQATGLTNVVFTGWLDATQLGMLAQRAWVGVGAYKKGALMTLTNKLFEYMAYGLPILFSLEGEARAIIEGARCGIYYEANEPHSLAAGIQAIAKAPTMRTQMASRAKQLFMEEYSADVVYNRMADHIENVVCSAL